MNAEKLNYYYKCVRCEYTTLKRRDMKRHYSSLTQCKITTNNKLTFEIQESESLKKILKNQDLILKNYYENIESRKNNKENEKTKCEYCSKNFSKRSNLNAHQRESCGIKKFINEYEKTNNTNEKLIENVTNEPDEINTPTSGPSTTTNESNTSTNEPNIIIMPNKAINEPIALINKLNITSELNTTTTETNIINELNTKNSKKNDIMVKIHKWINKKFMS